MTALNVYCTKDEVEDFLDSTRATGRIPSADTLDKFIRYASRLIDAEKKKIGGNWDVDISTGNTNEFVNMACLHIVRQLCVNNNNFHGVDGSGGDIDLVPYAARDLLACAADTAQARDYKPTSHSLTDSEARV